MVWQPFRVKTNKDTILFQSSIAYLLYILILPLECIRLPFFNQDILGEGVPSAWHTNRAVPARGLVKLSGHSTNEGGAISKGKKQTYIPQIPQEQQERMKEDYKNETRPTWEHGWESEAATPS